MCEVHVIVSISHTILPVLHIYLLKQLNNPPFSFISPPVLCVCAAGVAAASGGETVRPKQGS